LNIPGEGRQRVDLSGSIVAPRTTRISCKRGIQAGEVQPPGGVDFYRSRFARPRDAIHWKRSFIWFSPFANAAIEDTWARSASGTCARMKSTVI